MENKQNDKQHKIYLQQRARAVVKKRKDREKKKREALEITKGNIAMLYATTSFTFAILAIVLYPLVYEFQYAFAIAIYIASLFLIAAYAKTKDTFFLFVQLGFLAGYLFLSFFTRNYTWTFENVTFYTAMYFTYLFATIVNASYIIHLITKRKK